MARSKKTATSPARPPRVNTQHLHEAYDRIIAILRYRLEQALEDRHTNEVRTYNGARPLSDEEKSRLNASIEALRQSLIEITKLKGQE